MKLRLETCKAQKEGSKQQTQCYEGTASPPECRSQGSPTKFPPSQVERSVGVSWPPRRAGFLDLFSQKRGIAKELAKKWCMWNSCFDLEHSPSEDLDKPELRTQLFQLFGWAALLVWVEAHGSTATCAVS